MTTLDQPMIVSLAFCSAMKNLFPKASVANGDFLIEDAGDGVLRLKTWNIDAPIPTDAEIEAAQFALAETDNVVDLMESIEALSARLAALEAK